MSSNNNLVQIDFKSFIENQKKCAHKYSNFDFISRESGSRLIEKLDDIIYTSENNPKNILNLGSKVGELSNNLAKKFPDSNIYELELTPEMLSVSKNNKNNKNNKINFINGDFELLPFLSNSFDLIISNQALHYFDFNSILKEVFRVLNKNGLFLFSSLGPDSFKELKNAWAKIDSFPHVHKFWDMHIYGDMLKKFAFIDPVMDCQWVNFNYKNLDQLFLDLKNTGEQLIDIKRRKSLIGKNNFAKLYDYYPKNKSGNYDVSLEFIFGHVLKSSDDLNKSRLNNNGVAKISVDDILSYKK